MKIAHIGFIVCDGFTESVKPSFFVKQSFAEFQSGERLDKKQFPKTERISILGNCAFWWEKLDLNQRSLAATDLQPAPIDQTLAFSHIWRVLQDLNLRQTD